MVRQEHMPIGHAHESDRVAFSAMLVFFFFFLSVHCMGEEDYNFQLVLVMLQIATFLLLGQK